jgi:hypothetical protein
LTFNYSNTKLQWVGGEERSINLIYLFGEEAYSFSQEAKMKHVFVLIFASLILLGASSPESYSRIKISKKLKQQNDTSEAIPNSQNRSYTANDLWLCISNWGFLGSQMGDLKEPGTGLPLPSSRFPGRSELEYLFQGGIWVGAVVNYTPYVSLGCDGWQWAYEWAPDSGTTGAIVENEWWGDQEFIAVYCDTFIPYSPWGPEPYDNKPRPLGAKITQHSYCWETPGYDEFVILDYTIQNFGDDILYDPYIGFYMDVDAQHIDETPYGRYGAQDDITGFLKVYQQDTVNIA